MQMQMIPTKLKIGRTQNDKAGVTFWNFFLTIPKTKANANGKNTTCRM